MIILSIAISGEMLKGESELKNNRQDLGAWAKGKGHTDGRKSKGKHEELNLGYIEFEVTLGNVPMTNKQLEIQI